MEEQIEKKSKVVRIKTDLRNFYYMYVTKINYDLKLDLTRGEIRTLAEIMYEYYLRKDYNIEDIDKLVFNTDNRKKMIQNLNTTVHTFNNSLTSLRSARGIVGAPLNKKGINRAYLAFPNNTFQLIFNFELTDEERGQDQTTKAKQEYPEGS